MITTDSRWKEIASDPLHRTKIDLYIGDSDVQHIDDSRIKASPTITSKLFTSKLSIGNCVSSCLKFTIYAPDLVIEKASKVRMMCTVLPWDSDSTIVDEYDNIVVDERDTQILFRYDATIQLGTWYVDTRQWDASHQWLTLECYDMMAVLGNYTVKQAASKLGVTLSYPLKFSAAMNLVCGITGLTYDKNEVLIENYTFTKEDIDKMSLRDCAGYIAASTGSNMAADETGTKIRFLRLWVDYNEDIEIADEWNAAILDENDDAILYSDWESKHLFLDGQVLADLELQGEYEPIQDVCVIGKDKDTQTYHADSYVKDGILEVSWPLSSASVDLALTILESVQGFYYCGWRSDVALLDPSLQIGDTVIVDGKPTVLAEITATVGNAYIAGCGAANETGLAHELMRG